MTRMLAAIGLIASLSFAGQSKSDDRSTAYIIMVVGPKRFTSTLPLDIDGKLVARLRKDDFVKVTVTAGNRVFKFKGQKPWTFPIAVGQTFYFEAILEGPELRFTVTTREQAEKDMANMRSVPPLHEND